MRRIILGMIFLGLGTTASAQAPRPNSTAAPNPVPRYPGIKVSFNHGLSAATTNSQRLDVFRDHVAQGRYSGRPMMSRMFGNFGPGGFRLDPATPGVAATVRTLASDNRNLVRGQSRTIVYANQLAGDRRFQVVGLNQPRTTALGNTDADLVFKHRESGRQIRMEVKDVKSSSQLMGLPRLKSQILKMAEDARSRGEVAVWINRREVIPEVREFAERHGVRVEERVRTGTSRFHPSDRSLRAVVNRLDRDLKPLPQTVSLGGAVQAGLGAYMIYQSAGLLREDLSGFQNTMDDWMRIGQHGSWLAGGVGSTLAAAPSLTSRLPGLASSTGIRQLGRWGGRLGVIGVIGSEGFLLGQYFYGGTMTDRQFYRGQAGLGGGLAGGAAGAWAGAWAGAQTGGLIGSFLGPGGTATGAAFGGFVGGIGGGIAAGTAMDRMANQSVDWYFNFQDRKQQEQLAQFLIAHYR